MLDVQTVGTEILTNKPRSFYVFCGDGYGIKCKYLSILKTFYGEQVEGGTVEDLINMMNTKRIIPLEDKLYVVRYDEKFISSLSDAYADKISNSNIKGTIVCIYQDIKHQDKLLKYLPDNTVILSEVSEKLIHKYLSQDFPEFNSSIIDFICKISENYAQAQIIANCLLYLPDEMFKTLSQSSIAKSLGYKASLTEDIFKQYIADRNYHLCVQFIENYDSLDNLIYSILSTMLELEKCKCKGGNNSIFYNQSKNWSINDIFLMFQNTYVELEKLRSMSSYNIKDCLLYLVSMLPLSPIPDGRRL